jgi:hypothetical protein
MNSLTVIGMNQASRSTKFVVVVDGTEIYDSGMTGTAVIKANLPKNSKLLELVVAALGDNNFDHSYWCFPRFHRETVDRIEDEKLDGKAKKASLVSVEVGASVFAYNKAPWAPPIHFRDAQVCDEYLFAHAPSSVTYAVPDGMTRFTATGYNVRSCSVRYEVWAGGKQIYESPQAGIVPIDVKLPAGTKSIELKVDAMGKNDYDHSFWCYPRLHGE